jgi:transposase
MEMVSIVSEKHASEEVRSYCLFMCYFCGLKCMALSKYFDKAPSTITNWIKQFERGDGLSRAENEAVDKNPTIYLKEARQKFMLLSQVLYNLIRSFRRCTVRSIP